MRYDPRRHHRRSIRLQGYDYSRPGAYFITICTQDRACLFGDVVNGKMRLNDAGRMVRAEWDKLPQRFPTIELDAFVVMPNHVHGIIVLHRSTTTAETAPTPSHPVGAGLVPAPEMAGLVPAPEATAPTPSQPVGAGLVPAPEATAPTIAATTRVAPTVGEIVGAFKSTTTVLYTRGVRQFGWPAFRARVWQRNYHEHIIRNDNELTCIREYIANNPLQWELDRENPDTQATGRSPIPKDEP